MAIIHELSPHLADLIAAGEVVERPASVAKELIENAIDAGSTRITVEIEHGGISYLRIADNGCGMSADDAPVAFRRHATSKLRTEEDLSAIGTLGFRGEALAAISSVTRIDLFTRQSATIAGQHLHLEAGNITIQEEAGCPEGTTIVVRDLFYNTPARMKFLKKDFTEAGYILGVVQHAALSHPEIAFTHIRDGKQIFATDGKGKLITPVFAVFGKDMTENMLEIPKSERNGMTVYGYIVKPHAGRPNRSMQHFFVNGRYVKSRLMQAALEESYRNAMISGKYPSCAVFLEMPLSAVDVNVHPAKTEVKFSQDKPVFEAVYIACKNTLAAGDNIPVLKHAEKNKPERSPDEDRLAEKQQILSASDPVYTKPTFKPQTYAPELDDFLVSVPPRTEKKHVVAASPTITSAGEKESFVFRPYSKQSDASSVDTAAVSPPKHNEEDHAAVCTPKEELELSTKAFGAGIRVIGECFQTYIIAEDENGLILIDKHAAHERILFNKLRAETEIPQQELLVPVIVELTGEEAAAIRSQIDDIRTAGFSIDAFGENSFAIRSAPAYLDCGDIKDVISELADKAMNCRAAVPDRLDELIHTIACKAAIKAGKNSNLMELQDLCERVMNDSEVRSCPHGRPTTVRLTKYELHKLFKRVNQ